MDEHVQVHCDLCDRDLGEWDGDPETVTWQWFYTFNGITYEQWARCSNCMQLRNVSSRGGA